MYGSNFIKQHSETIIWFEVSKVLIAVLKNKFIYVIHYNFWQTFVPYNFSG